MKKVLFLSTLDLNIHSFCKEHILNLSKKYKVFVLTNYKNKKKIFRSRNIFERHINIYRDINFIYDIKILIQIYLIFFREKFDLIVTITPKAGLLGGIIGYLLNIKRRLHIFTGQIWSTKKGFLRFLLMNCDKFITLISTDIIFDSRGQLDFVKKYFYANSKFHTINHGSINGVDTRKFKPNSKKKKEIRKELNIGLNDIVLLYTGRLNNDKGIDELINIFFILRKSIKNIKLFLIGSDEQNFTLKYKNNNDIYFYPHMKNLIKFYQMSDIYCSFSKREGFGVSLIEASACSLPIFCSNIYGFRETVKNNFSGIKFDLFSKTKNISKKLESLIKNKKLQKKLGTNGRLYVKKYFEKKIVVKNYNNYFKNLLD